MIKKFLFIIGLLISFNVYTQYTEVINSNRPGFSESPYSVGTGVYQLESSLFYRKAAPIPKFSNPKAIGLNLLFRTSFFLEKLELNLNTSFGQDNIAFKNVFESSYNKTGFSQLTLGAKYLVYQPTYKDKTKEIRSWKKRMAFDWKRLIPAVAVYGGVNFGSILTDYHNRGGITPKAGILLQNHFSYKFNLVTNFYYDYIGANLPEFSHIITATYNFDDYWSGFIEHQALYNKQETKSNLGIGAAYLFNKNLQFNASARATFQNNITGYYASLGASYRIDTHKDDYVEIDEYGNKIDRKEYNKSKKQGFFGKLFSGFGLFKKKNKHNPKVDLELNTGESKRRKPTRQRKKSVSNKKKKKGLFGGLFSKKNKKETEEEKLEREVKELEKELKQEEKEEKRQKRRRKRKNKDKDE